MELFIPEGSNTDKFYQLDLEYFKTGFDVNIIVENPNLDYSSEETQLQLQDFYNKLETSYNGSQDWF